MYKLQPTKVHELYKKFIFKVFRSWIHLYKLALIYLKTHFTFMEKLTLAEDKKSFSWS